METYQLSKDVSNNNDYFLICNVIDTIKCKRIEKCDDTRSCIYQDNLL